MQEIIWVKNAPLIEAKMLAEIAERPEGAASSCENYLRRRRVTRDSGETRVGGFF
jgi:hypothetical protein